MAAGSLVSVQSLRRALVAVALILVVVLAVFIGKARFFRPHFHLDAKKLGFDISTDSEGVTLSNSELSVTQFTVHAARRIQYKDGRMSLYDVGIVLCGSKGDRADRIHGSQFEYDQKNGLLTAVGDVFIDLAPPASGKLVEAASAARHCDSSLQGDPARVIHMKTSGLVFQQKEQIAHTDSRVDFQSGGMTGSSVGASYDAPNGIIDLHTDVRVSGLRGSGLPGRSAPGGDARPMVLTAAHAEIDMDDGKQPGNVAYLDAPHVVETADDGSESASAQHAVVHMMTDGTPRLITANGAVALSGTRRGTVTSDKLELELHPNGQPGAAHLWGMVRFARAESARQPGQPQAQATRGEANDARIAFDAAGNPVRALLTGAVRAEQGASAGTRTLVADKVDLALAGGGHAPVEVRGAQASASAGARLHLVDAGSGSAAGSTLTTDVKADLLTARFVAQGNRSEVSGVDGTGDTVVARAQTDSKGVQVSSETGTGATLKLDFAPAAGGRQQLARAEQRGGVTLVREAAPKPNLTASAKAGGGTKAAPDVEHAQGEDAVYDATTDRMTLTGGVKVSDADSALFADRVLFERATGDATADGSVRVSYLQGGSGAEPMHVVAARAIAHKATGLTEFFGAPGADARMWQGGSQVLAPVLDFNRTRRTLVAHGSSEGAAVKTLLVDSGPQGKGTPPSAKKEASRPSGPVRVLSRQMTYSDVSRQVVFEGGVQVSGQDGTLRSREATAFLAPRTSAAAKDEPPVTLGGRVERIVSEGGVEIVQPGRKATGENLVYTAADRTFVLTGTSAQPPKLVDETQGTVTGASLRFRTGDDSVEVLSGDGQPRVRTETRIKQKD